MSAYRSKKETSPAELNKATSFDNEACTLWNVHLQDLVREISTYPRCRIPAFLPFGIKAGRVSQAHSTYLNEGCDTHASSKRLHHKNIYIGLYNFET